MSDSEGDEDANDSETNDPEDQVPDWILDALEEEKAVKSTREDTLMSEFTLEAGSFEVMLLVDTAEVAGGGQVRPAEAFQGFTST